ncbi:hypothetical protein HanPSC8_Chr13g0552311 [Helianthus annuus]|nr:hypothetical protein HanPSC8_Chr13g0552311 [Helianthus annuus]
MSGLWYSCGDGRPLARCLCLRQIGVVTGVRVAAYPYSSGVFISGMAAQVWPRVGWSKVEEGSGLSSVFYDGLEAVIASKRKKCSRVLHRLRLNLLKISRRLLIGGCLMCPR